MVYFIGIDVSKKSLDLAVLKDGSLVLEGKIENTAAALRAFLKELITGHGVHLNDLIVCMEHTGIYNAVALEVFWKKGVRICVEPALQIKQSQGMTRGKSDRVDARRIANYAYKNHQELVFWMPQRTVVQKMQALLSLRERLVRAKVQLEVPLRESIGFVNEAIIKELRKCTQAALDGIKKNLWSVEARIKEIISHDVPMSNQVKQITSVPGIGLITAVNMIVATGEFTRIRRSKKFACYSGVAPFEHSSGTSIKGRSRVSRLANMNLKRLLHLAAMSAIKTDNELRAFYLRKVAAGKNKMSVLNAVRNKLISRAFSCVTEERIYQKNYEYVLA